MNRIFFYKTFSGRSPIEEFLSDLPKGTQLEVADALLLLSDRNLLSMPLSRDLSSIKKGLHELRFKERAGQVRVFYYVKNRTIYILHALRKKTRTIPKRELITILGRIMEI